MKDFSGFALEPQPMTWKPRGGQWCLVRLRDPARMVALAQQGAHVARDGSLVAIHVGAHFAPGVVVKRSDGKIEQQPGEQVPAKLVIVHGDGNNLPWGRRNGQGHLETVDVWFHPASPEIATVRPLLDKADMPPGRVVDPDWQPTP